MAEINVERKSGRNLLPLLIGLVLLAALAWALFSLLGGDDDGDVEVRESTPAATAPAQP